MEPADGGARCQSEEVVAGGFRQWPRLLLLRYPEVTIQHFHGYEEGFAGRMKIV